MRVTRAGLLRPGFQNSLTDSKLPSGSLNQATFAPPGAIQIPIFGLHHALEFLQVDAGLGESPHRRGDIWDLPAKYSIGRRAILSTSVTRSIVPAQSNSSANGLSEFSLSPRRSRKKRLARSGIGRRDEGDEWRAIEHRGNITGDGWRCQPCNAGETTYHRLCDHRALCHPPLSCRTSPPHGGRLAAVLGFADPATLEMGESVDD